MKIALMKQLMKWLICNQHEVLFLLLLLSYNAFGKSKEYYKEVIISDACALI